MNIRKYTMVSIIIFLISLILLMVSYHKYFSLKAYRQAEEINAYSRIVKTDEKAIKIYKDSVWEEIDIKGVELSSFRPGYGRFKTGIPKKEVSKWLEEIGQVNANLIKVPYIQPPSFYSAIYDYNLNREEPLYVIHEIMLDEKDMLENYDAFDGKIIKKLKKDIRKTINVIHGQGLILNTKRSHSGLYLKDISSYNMGLIIGTNTNPEIVTLTNASNKGKNQYDGEFFFTSEASPFEIFIAEILDYTNSFETEKYNSLSLLSFLTSVDTDPLEYKHESNASKHAKINLENIQAKKESNIFASYKLHPNSFDFLDYEYTQVTDNESKEDQSGFLKQLKRINRFYSIPLVISDTGISSSRGISKVDISDGYNRGGFSENEQGEMIVDLLEDIGESGAQGAIISSWQDNWTNLTSFSMVEDYLDESASSYWHDLQSSDENFGLLKFESGKEDEKVYIDGDLSDWKDTGYLIDEENIKLKVKDTIENLYILLEKEDWSLNDDLLYLGIDISPLSGSKTWRDEAGFETAADFVIKLDGYNESRLVVNERYNIFDYIYKYYTNAIEKKEKPPQIDSDNFSAIYLLNRKNFYEKDTNEVHPPIYYETGKLMHGTDNPKDKEFNSLADFNKTNDTVEIKLPWALLNIKNPLEKTAYGDFYANGIRESLKIENIGFSINFKGKEEFKTKEVRYDMEKIRNIEYFERIKKSYYIVKDYWKSTPKVD